MGLVANLLGVFMAPTTKTSATDGMQHSTLMRTVVNSMSASSTPLQESDYEVLDSRHTDVDDECSWHDFSSPPREDIVCRSGVSARMHATVVGHAFDRALKCSARYGGAECVLASEVGLLIPGFFVFDGMQAPVADMTMVLVPRVLGPVVSSGDRRRIRVYDMLDRVPPVDRVFNRSLVVQYITGTRASLGSLSMVTSELYNSSAYCMQLLQATLTEECVQQLDFD